MILPGETKVLQAHGDNSTKAAIYLVFIEQMIHIAHHIMMVMQALPQVHQISITFLDKVICVCMTHLLLEVKTELIMGSGWIKEENCLETTFLYF